MPITQTKELSKNTYLSFSDRTKTKMNRFQFCLPSDISCEVEKWLRTGTNYPYYIERYSKKDGDNSWVLFINEGDAVAFKLKWM